MGTAITTGRVDLQTLISSPELLVWRRISLGTVRHPGLPVRKYLSGGLTLTAEDRLRIKDQLDQLRSVSKADDSLENRKSRLAVITTMLLAYPMATGTEESGKARAGAYLSSVDDVPPWAIAEAIRLWHRGEGGGRDGNYRFAPAPAELRFSAMQLLQPAKQVIAHLEALLDALTLEEAMDQTPVARAHAAQLRRIP